MEKSLKMCESGKDGLIKPPLLPPSIPFSLALEATHVSLLFHIFHFDGCSRPEVANNFQKLYQWTRLSTFSQN